MNSTFTKRADFIKAIQAVAAEAGMPAYPTCIMSDQDELFDGESQWKVRFDMVSGPVINITEHVDEHADEEEDRSYQTAALLESDKADAAYSMSRSWPRSMLFDLREKLIPGYSNAVVETPEGFVWRVVSGNTVRELKVKLHTPEHPSSAGDYEFSLDTAEANAFFDVAPCVYDNGDYIDYEKAVERSAEKFVIRTFWFSGDSDSFGPLIRCAKFTLANGVVLHASYG